VRRPPAAWNQTGRPSPLVPRTRRPLPLSSSSKRTPADASPSTRRTPLRGRTTQWLGSSRPGRLEGRNWERCLRSPSGSEATVPRRTTAREPLGARRNRASSAAPNQPGFVKSPELNRLFHTQPERPFLFHTSQVARARIARFQCQSRGFPTGLHSNRISATETDRYGSFEPRCENPSTSGVRADLIAGQPFMRRSAAGTTGRRDLGRLHHGH
jgi:hypothetical protein